MLSQVLSEIRKSRNPLSLTALSHKLVVSPSVLEGMLQQLLAMGYLKVEDGQGSAAESAVGRCAGCAAHSACALPGPRYRLVG